MSIASADSDPLNTEATASDDSLAERRLFYSAIERRNMERNIGIEKAKPEGRSGNSPAALVNTTALINPPTIVNNTVAGVAGDTATFADRVNGQESERHSIKPTATQRLFTFQGIVAGVSGWQVVINSFPCLVASSGVVTPNCGGDAIALPVMRFNAEDQMLVVDIPGGRTMRMQVGDQQWLP
ncbi:MAG: hypothetical protein V3U76_11565 [Granulosicoccus sp.]